MVSTKPPLAKGKRPMTSESEGLIKKTKKSSDSSLSEKEKGKEKSKKTTVRPSANDIFTLELPKGLTELDKDGSLAFIQHLHTLDDNFVYSSYTSSQVERAAAQNLCQFLTLFGRLSKHSGPSTADGLRDDLEKRDQDLVRATKDLSSLTAEVESLKRQLAEEKSATEKVHTEFLKHFQEKEENLRAQFQEKEEDLRTQGFIQGLEFCKKQLFKTPPGQIFLKDLHEGLISAYQKSTLYLEHVGRFIGHFVGHGFKAAVRQVRAKGITREMCSGLDPMLALENITASSAFEGDESLPPTHPWWLPVMKEAINKLEKATLTKDQLSTFEALLYDWNMSEGDTSDPARPIKDEDPCSEDVQAPQQ